MVNKETVSALRVDLYDLVDDKHPADVLNEFRPTDLVQEAWIPQTLGDQIWIAYQFRSVEERLAWEAQLNESIKRWLAPELVDPILEIGMKIFDFNGFEIG